jgi:hypothetical protein
VDERRDERDDERDDERGDGRDPARPVDLRWVAGAAAAVVLVAARWSASHGLQLIYADARSHLTIARRLVDGPNRGLVQLGTVWLPLQHLLLAPLTAIDQLWTTGWAGALVGAGCMAIEVVALWRIAEALDAGALGGGARLADLLAVVLYVTNPTILFLHTSSFTEPVLYAAVLWTTSALVRWANVEERYSGGEMALWCGGPAALAVLGRYDGWAFVAAAGACVLAISWRRWGSARHAWKMTACFGAPSAVAALWWMWFNWVNYGDSLEFQRGRYSAQAQQEVLARQELLPDEGDLLGSIGTFLRAASDAAGWIALLAAAAGLVVVVVRLRRSHGATPAVPRTLGLVLVLTGVPAAFYVWSLFTGQIALRFGDVDGESIFNLRYGAAAIPGLAVLAGCGLAALGGAVAWRRVAAGALALTPFVALAIVPGWREVGVIREGLEQREAGAAQWEAARWLEAELDGGTLLIDDSVNPMLPVIGAGLDDVVAPFSRDWDDRLADPSPMSFVFIDRGNPDDEVGRAVAADPEVLDGFELAAEFAPVAIYRNEQGGRP